MILPGPPPDAPGGLWLLEGVPLAGKTALLRRWRARSPHRVLWSAEDAATQRRFEPLSQRHRPEAVEPWLEALLAAWEALEAGARDTAWGREGAGFAAHQERFHLRAALEGGLAPGAFERLEARLAALGARGVLLRAAPHAHAARLAVSFEARPPSWPAWVRARFGGPEAALEAWRAQEAAFLDLAERSALPWFLPAPGAEAVDPPGGVS